MRLFFVAWIMFFLSFSALGKGIIYMMHPEGANWTGRRTEFREGSPLYNIRQAFARLGYDAIWTNSIRGLQDYDYIICWDIPYYEFDNLKRIPKEKLIAFLWEPPTILDFNYDKKLHEHFWKIYTWDDSLVDAHKYFQFYYPVYRRMSESEIPFEEKKLCVMINCNKDSRHPSSLYGKRRKLIQFFENNFSNDFDLYGRGWGSVGLKNYKGEIDSKPYYLKDYRFYFAYENMRDVHGYVTEKIFDAFRTGCVPVYWGAKNVTDYIPKECFIDRRDFKDNEELYWFLKNMSKDEHQRYIDNIKRFLDSDQSLVFSMEYYIDIFLTTIEPGYDKTVGLTEWQRAIVERADSYLQRRKK